jgi:phosphotransferase system enzyme I (PtsI)
LELDLSGVRGIATIKGSPTSHVAILARARGIPMIVGCGEGLSSVQDGMDALLDADKGVLAHTANAEDTSKFVRRIEERAELLRHAAYGVRLPAMTVDGQHVRVLANLDSIDILEQLDVQAFDGVGLVRTEFLFQDGAFPNEQDQYAAISRILDWASGRPVTVRLLDVGGDKPIQGLTVDGEENPFLGIRGIRLMRYRPEIFRTQLRALARAAVHGDLKVMVPMVAIPAEMAEIRSEMRNQVEALRKAGQDCRMPPMGMMVEVPSAALRAAEFDTDFYSIGTNDLIQYTLAAARDDYRLSYLSRDDISAVLALIERVVATGLARNRETSVCGDMASDPAMVGYLLQARIRCLSVAPASVAIVKHMIRNWPTMEQDK